MSRWPEDLGGRQPEGGRARQPEGRRGRQAEGRHARQAEGRHDPDDTLPWLAALDEDPEEDAEWARKLRPRQAPRVDMPGPEPPGLADDEEPERSEFSSRQQWRPAEPSYDALGDDLGDQTGSWSFDDEPATRPPYPDATAAWQPESRHRADPPPPRPAWELPAPPRAEAAASFWEPSAPAWEPEPHAGEEAGPAPWEAGPAPAAEYDFGSLFAEQAPTQSLPRESLPRESLPRESLPPESSWRWEDEREQADLLSGGEPVVPFGPPSGRALAPATPAGPARPPHPAAPGRALEPPAAGREHDASGRDASDQATQAWARGATGDGEWPRPAGDDSRARMPGGRRVRAPEDGHVVGRGEAVAPIEGRHMRQLEARPDGRRARQRPARVRRRWPVRLAILAWIVLFAVICWLYVFPWLEGVLPENF